MQHQGNITSGRYGAGGDGPGPRRFHGTDRNIISQTHATARLDVKIWILKRLVSEI